MTADETKLEDDSSEEEERTRLEGSDPEMTRLEGDCSIAVAYDVKEEAKKYDYRPYQFAGKEYYEPDELAAALGKDWMNGVKNFGRGFLTEWIKNEFHHIELTNRLMDVEEDVTLDASQKLSVALMILNSELPLLDEQGVFSRDSASSRASALLEILSSGLGGWLKELRGDSWMLKLKRECDEFRSKIHKYLKDLDETLAVKLFLLPEEAFVEKREEFIEQYGACSIPSLNKLFSTKGETSSKAEEIALLSLHRESLKTHEEIYENTVVSFNCPKLKAVLRMEMKAFVADIIRKDFLSLNKLRAEAVGISDLSGIEYATNLTELYLSRNQITDVTPLAKLTNLQTLHLCDNQIIDLIPLAGLTNLTELYLGNNQITDVSPLANLTNLKELDFQFNQVADVSSSDGLTNLNPKPITSVCSWPGSRFIATGPFFCRGINYSLLRVNPGIFVVRHPWAAEDVAFSVPHEFWLGERLITQTEYQQIVGPQTSHFRDSNQLPVETVSWLECIEFCKELTQAEQRKGSLPHGYEFRLPLEVEWEYACRAGSSTPYFFGTDPDDLVEYAWVRANSERRTHEVALKKPNPWGFYDMYGNVREWVHDSYHNILEDLPDEIHDEFRICRGGGYMSRAKDCESAARSTNSFFHRFRNLGFRIALSKVHEETS